MNKRQRKKLRKQLSWRVPRRLHKLMVAFSNHPDRVAIATALWVGDRYHV